MNSAPLYALAPMAGYTDYPMRALCFGYGCAFAVTEMVSCCSVMMGIDRSAVSELLLRRQTDKHLAVQLFGADPRDFAEAVKIIFDKVGASPTPTVQFDAVEINMGCPAPKVTSSGAGCALLKDMKLAAAIMRETIRCSPVPVGIKTRTGWDAPDKVEETARIASGEGVSYITVHGRTRAAMFGGDVDYDAICRMKKAFRAFVFGNGDVRGIEDARRMIERTGCDGVMIGRAAIRAPWVFGELCGEGVTDIRKERHDTALRHARSHGEWKGEKRAIPELRGKLAHYFAGLPNAAKYRALLQKADSLSSVECLIEEFASL